MLRLNHARWWKKLVCRAESTYGKNSGQRSDNPKISQSYKIRPHFKPEAKLGMNVVQVDLPHSLYLRTAKRCNFCKSLKHFVDECPKKKMKEEEEEAAFAESMKNKVPLRDVPVPPFEQAERGDSDHIPAEIFNKTLYEGNYQLRFLCSSVVMDAVKQAGYENVIKKFGAALTISKFTDPEGVVTLLCPKDHAIDCLEAILPGLVLKRMPSPHTIQEEDDRILKLLIPAEKKFSLTGGRMRPKLTALLESLKLTPSQLRIAVELCPQSYELAVTMRSPSHDQIMSMVKAILPSTMTPVKGPQLLYEPSYHDPRLAKIYGGYSDDYEKEYTWDTSYKGQMKTEIITVPKELEAQLQQKDCYSLQMCTGKSTCHAKFLKMEEQSEESNILVRGILRQRKLLIHLLRRSVESTPAGRLYLHGDAGKKTYFHILFKMTEQPNVLE